ncbi:hypothetical protein BG011_009206 [Mortierella polycephala]|uniref:Uncharacterized protein n=1 Tax=Mortierella polycephala TaxID=41804 RepID=A0A9P6PNS3_9FUNG|nr:hypothetical protein BG011_009206 [Mortierella polycephala]
MVRVSIQGKITSKKISSWLKATFARNSILTIAPPGDNGLQPEEDSQDHLDHSDHDQHHDGDGYLSDTSNLSAGEVTDPDSTDLKTRPPLRRAISLDDLTTSTAIHRQSHSWGLLRNNRMRSGQQVHLTHPSHPTYPSSQALNQHLSTGISPVIRPASAASAYNRHQHSESIEQGVPSVPLKDRPQSAMSMHKDHVNHLETYSLSQDRGDHSSLPTPEASLEELSDSSDELVIIQGELLEEARSVHSVDRIRSPQHRHNTYPGASRNASAGADPRSSGDLAADCEWPEQPSQQKSQDKDKPNPWFDIPLQFIALLTYPEPDPKNGNKMTLTMVRETSFVRQRRRTLLMLTAYTLLVRYCSFDFFLVVLFASNCAMLFLMKNSGRMNVNMAKRAVRQRVGWAKQWAGGIFKRGGNNSNNNANHQSNSNNGDNGHCGSIPHNNVSNSQHPNASIHSSAMQESAKGQQASLAPNEGTASTSAEASPQMRRRGLFGKRISVGATNSHPGHSASAPVAVSVHAHQSDGASMMTAATRKRRFFRRAQNSTPSHDTALAPSRTNAPSSSTLLRPQRANTGEGGGGGASTTASLNPKAQALNTPLSSSPLAQSLSLPHLHFSPPKAFNPHMSVSDTTLLDGEEAKWAARTRPMAHTPPLSLSTSATPLRQSLDILAPPLSLSLSPKALPAADYPRSGLHSTSETLVSPMPIPVSMASSSKRAMSPPACSALSQLLYRSEDGVKDEILSSSPPPLLLDRTLQSQSAPSSAGRGRESVLVLDAVTSTSADAMDDFVTLL